MIICARVLTIGVVVGVQERALERGVARNPAIVYFLAGDQLGDIVPPATAVLEATHASDGCRQPG